MCVTWRALSISPSMTAWCYGTLKLPMLPEDDSDSDAEEAKRYSAGEWLEEKLQRDNSDSDAEEAYRYTMGNHSDEELPSDDSDSDAEEGYRYHDGAVGDWYSKGMHSEAGTYTGPLLDLI